MSANPRASSNELVERVEAETEDSDLSDVIPQLDGPAEETPTYDEETMEDDSEKEEQTVLSHLPTADDPDRLDEYINQLDQEKIETCQNKN